MNLIKKNILMVLIISITVVIATVMIYFVIQDTAKMKNSTTKVANLSKEINKLNDEKPSPLQENLDMINNDIDQVSKKVAEIQSIFGVSYSKPIKIFAEKLGLTKKELIKEWKIFYKEERNKGNKRSLIFVNFKTQFDQDKVKEAIQSFTDLVNSTSFEYLNETNVSGAIMEGMGLPREMDEISCKQYIQDMQRKTIEYMKSNNKEDNSFEFYDDIAKKISFEKYENSMPRPDEVPFIFKHWNLLEDLFRRLKSSNITNLQYLRRDNLLKGEVKNKEYQVFSYSMEVKGSLDSIRALLNSMVDAYKHNKVYIIKSLILVGNDEAASIINNKNETPAKTNRRRRFNRGMDIPVKKEEKKEKDSVAIIGISNKVTATITFDYIIFIGNEIKGR